MAAVEQIASKRTLILLVEDMHWADFATTDLCHALARERSPAAVLVIVTMRSAEAMVRDHPISSLRRDLVTKGLAEEIALAPFESGALSDYLAARCPGLDQHANLGDRLLEQTAGNPLFVRLVVDEWIASGRVLLGNDGRWGPAGDPEELDRTVPDSVRFLLDGQIAQLDAEQRAVLEAGSLHGGDFHATSIAGVLGEDPERVEEICRSISRRRQLLGYGGRVATGNGSMAEQYGFLHATVRRVVANGIQSSRRRRLHRAFAEQLRSEHAGRTFAISSQLAVHDEAAGDIPNAVQSLRDSAKLAMRRDSPKDAVVILERVLTLLDENPETPDNDGERVLALSYLSHAHQLAHGFGAPQVAALWSRTRELAGSIQDAREQAVADAGRIMVCCVTARYADAEEVIREALPKLDDNVDEGGRQALMFSAATVRYRVGALDDAALLFESALALKNASDPVPGADLVAVLMSQYAPVLVLSGRTEAARRMVRESVERARAHSHYSECVTSTIAAWALGLLHDYAGAVPIAARAFELAEADNYRTWMTRPQFLLGIAAMREGRIEEGLTKVRAAIETRESEGQLVDHSAHLCLLADALMDAGQEGAGEILDKAQAFVASSGELFAECDVYRLRAKERRLSGADAEEVEALLRRAIKLAVLRDMHWHRLLAARDLATLFFGLGRDDEARATLEPALGLVESGPEVRAASQLLNR